LKSNILLIIAIIIGLLNLWYINQQPERLILVTPEQKSCLDSWVGVENEYALFGPEIFEGHSLVTVKKHFTNEFESDVSGCFYDRHTEVVDYKKIPEMVQFLKATGSKEVYFYKPLNSDNLIIYGSSK
jgi:hypothetical protein